MIRTTLVVAALLAAASSATAQDAVDQARSSALDNWTLSFGAATDNRSKEVSKSNGDAFAWGVILWESDDGLFYGGVGAEGIESNGSSVEVETQAGVAPQYGGFDLNFNVAHKYRPGSDDGDDDDAWEFTADMSRSIGPASGRLRLQHSPDGTSTTEAWTWVEARVGWEFTPDLFATAAVGRREQDNSIDYTGWNAGVTYALNRNVEVDLRYHATDADEFGIQFEDALVGGISFAF